MGISVEMIRDIAPDLEKPYQKAGFAASKHGLDGVKAAVYLVLDRSESMDWPGRNHYSHGHVQHFSERILGMAAHFEDDGRVPVVFFDHGLKGLDELSLENYRGKIQKAHSKLGRMGGTDYAVAMDAVVQHYLSTGKTVPALVIFQTDGSPRNKKAAAQKICEYSRLPVFWQFVGFGEDRDYDYDDDEGLGFLQRLDDIPVPQYRPIDNSDFFAVGEDPTAMSDSVLYNRLMNEFPGWMAEARRQGILR
jgi:hypothetical protein